MIFLSFRVPMSKFGAKVELRCNDGINIKSSCANVYELSKTFFFTIFCNYLGSDPHYLVHSMQKTWPSVNLGEFFKRFFQI